MAANQDRASLLQDKLLKSVNFLDYTGLTYQEIITKINQKVSADPSLDNFRESSLAQTFFEIFAGAVDVVNYYLDRRSEECYIDTAQLRSSVILLAKQLGYIVTRPIPATSNIKMTIKGSMIGVSVGNTILIPAQTKFTYDGNPYILTDSFQYTLSADQVGAVPSATNYNVQVDIDPRIIQGELKYKEITGITNQQIGQLFQVYKIEDKTFSNLYGTEDIATGNVINNIYVPNDNSLTLVGVGNDRQTATYYNIDRRSLLNWESLTSFTNTSAAADICLIRTTPDENIEIIFGDNKYASIGAESGFLNVYLQYFSTIGAKANKVGVIGDKILCNDSISTNNSVDVTSNISFQFTSNIINGSDMESLESIKYNAPGIYYSLDRCVTAKDYINYLKSLTTPFVVKNAIAWGEQEEINATGTGVGMYQFINVVMYSLLGHLYDLTSEPHTWNNISNVVLEPSFSADGTETQSSYFNLIVNKDPMTRIQDLQTSAVCDNVRSVNNKLQERAQVTVKNVYISPIIQDFDISGTVYLRKLSDSVSVNNKIINSVYEFLDENADFHTNIYKSNIVELIENFKEVVYTNISFISTSPTVDKNIFSWLVTVDYQIELQIVNILNNFCSDTNTWDWFSYPSLETFVLNNPNGNTNFSSLVGHELNPYGAVYTERNFYNSLMYKINSVLPVGWLDNNLGFMACVHANFAKAIKQNTFDTQGNIIYDNLAQYVPLRNEIARLNVNLNYQYK